MVGKQLTEPEGLFVFEKESNPKGSTIWTPNDAIWAQLNLLKLIRDELRSLKNGAGAIHELHSIRQTLDRIDRRMAKHFPLGKGRPRKR